MKKITRAKDENLNELSELCQKVAKFGMSETEYGQILEAFRDNEEKYRSLVESTDDFIYMVDKEYKYLFMNKKCLSVLGISEEEGIGKPYRVFHSPDETKKFIAEVEAVLENGKSAQYEYQSPRDGGYFLRTLSPVRTSDGEISGVGVISKNVTELKRLQDELRFLSLTDELTGLYNRRGFITLAEQQLKMAKRLKIETFMLYGDLDHLKQINDTFGHKEGDFALAEASKILRSTCRDSDIIARIGGDEFAVFPVGTSEQYAQSIIERLQKNFERFNLEKNRGYVLSLSVGITRCPSELKCSLQSLLVRADELMYEHKSRKRSKKHQ